MTIRFFDPAHGPVGATLQSVAVGNFPDWLDSEKVVPFHC
jgi:hypothetical protein